jgi:hypothetical protein
VATNGQTRGQQREENAHHRKKLEILISYEKSMGSLTLSKDALREEGTPWLIKRPGERNLSDVEHFNRYIAELPKFFRYYFLSLLSLRTFH